MRLRTNFAHGLLDVGIGSSTDELSSPRLARLPVVEAPDIAVVTLDSLERDGPPEIVHVTAHASEATTATALRGQEGTEPRAHPSGTRWEHSATVADYAPEAIGAESVANKGEPDGYAPLDEAGEIPIEHLPALVVGNKWTVAGQAEMLALDATRGDIAIRTDLDRRLMLVGDDPSDLDLWRVLHLPDDVVETLIAGDGINVSGVANVTVSLDPAVVTAIDDAADHIADDDNPHGVTAAQIGAAPAHPDIESVSSGSYTLQLADDGKVIEFTGANSKTVTVPNNSSVEFPPRTQILLRQVGSGSVTVASAGGVTVQSADDAYVLRGQYSLAGLMKTGTNTWALGGDVVEAD